MKTKVIFLLAVVALGVTLLVLNLITFQDIWDNRLEVGILVGGVYVWLNTEENNTKIKEVKATNEVIKAENQEIKSQMSK